MRYYVRKATMHDADFLLRVKNDSETRKNSIVTHRKILRKNHLKWLKDRIKRNDVVLFVIMNQNGERCGDIRFDIEPNGTAEVSVRIDRKQRGKGIASQIVGRIGPYVADAYKVKLTAKIVDGNLASLMVFLKNGYHLTAHTDKIIHLERYYGC